TEGEARQPVRGSLVTLGALAASLLLAVALAVSLTWQPAPQVVAVLLDDAGQPFALVEGAEDNTTRITVLGEAEVPDGRVLQVWTKPGPDRPPVSLGTVARAVGATLGARGLPPPTAGQLYEITLEVQGGSPTGLPTGPILGKGLARVPK
ncbi:anti-sigma factor, partial [Paralimibaculum aggregatum]|uniref:anti-sigma factor n=1 Tax=Paralimibaculum aggregatum TaxID=3036245 RepID=UPI00255794B9